MDKWIGYCQQFMNGRTPACVVHSMSIFLAFKCPSPIYTAHILFIPFATPGRKQLNSSIWIFFLC
ncbi:hypothetical protein BX666DRAFT_1995562 [Dichotomocladium elegans]|nr:hypothetical protein BX666DRAFT_1995562 [Dichotomocladium elegans]